MALIKCPECRGDVSDKAAVCPHCGYYKTQRRLYDSAHDEVSLGEKVFKVGAGVIWVGGFIVAIWLGNKLGDSFSFWAFLAACAVFGIQGSIYLSIAELFVIISSIHDRIGSAKMDSKVN